MKFHPRDATMWFFCWASTKVDPGRDYPTSLVSFSRSGLIETVEKEFNQKWRQIYREGGRAVKCNVRPSENHS